MKNINKIRKICTTVFVLIFIINSFISTVGALYFNIYTIKFPVSNCSTKNSTYIELLSSDRNLGNTIYFYNNITNGTGNWTIPTNIFKIDVLVVGGGGGAGKGSIQPSRDPGAGGAGGLIWLENVTKIGDINIIPGNVIPYSIGAGGIGATVTTSCGDNGGDTTFGNLTAKGGGGGGSINNLNGTSGGSGGGGSRNANIIGAGGTETQTTQTGWSGEYGYGNNGANAVVGSSGGGGGGSGGAGSGVNGGAGMNMSAYFGTDYGVNGVFAKGGNGGSDGSAGIANSGNGANANPDKSSANGASGGSGIILIRMYYSSPLNISNILLTYSNPKDTNPAYGWENITATVTDDVEVSQVRINITYPDMHTENISMINSGGGVYYYNTTFTVVGSYSYFIWAIDINSVSEVSVINSYTKPPNWDINMDGICNFIDFSMVSAKWLQMGAPGWIRDDINNDGTVNIMDVSMVSFYWLHTWS